MYLKSNAFIFRKELNMVFSLQMVFYLFILVFMGIEPQIFVSDKRSLPLHQVAKDLIFVISLPVL